MTAEDGHTSDQPTPNAASAARPLWQAGGQWRRAGRSLIVSLLAYAIYWLAVVTWCIPDWSPGRRMARHTADVHSVRPIDRYREQLSVLFPAGSWELKDPHIVQSDQATLLMEDCRMLSDGRLRIWPCTVVFYSRGRQAWQPGENLSPVILQAPGATLRFEEPLDLQRAELGRPVQGQLEGPIRIYRPTLAPEDTPLELTTETLQIDRQKIWTTGRVEFQWGEHRGRGRDLIIQLARPDASREHDLVAHLDSIELVEVEYLELADPDGPEDRAAGQPPRPLTVTCRGSLRLDVPNRVLALDSQVQLRRPWMQTEDRARCDLLEVEFQLDSPEGPTPRPASAIRLHPVRIRASGNPVHVELPSYQVASQGARLEYEFSARQVDLIGNRDHPAWLKTERHWISAPAIHFRPGSANQLGTFRAEGAGRYRGSWDPAQQQPLEAQWAREITFGPSDGRHRLSAIGTVVLSSSEFGELRAETITADARTIRRTPPAGQHSPSPNLGLRLERVVAEQNVQLQSPRLTVATSELRMDVAPPLRREGLGAAPADSPSSHWDLGRSGRDSGLSERGTRLAVEGDKVHVTASQTDQTLAVHSLQVTNQVVIRVCGTGDSGEQLRIEGQAISVHDLPGSPMATVVGRPAHIQGPAFHLRGGRIEMDQAASRLWIDGPGRLEMPMDTVAAAPAAATAQLQWQRRMEFNGLEVQFLGDVWLQTPQTRMHLDRLDVQLNQGLSFQDPPRDFRLIQPKWLRGYGQVQGERRVRNPDGTFQWDRFTVGGSTMYTQANEAADSEVPTGTPVPMSFQVDYQSGEGTAAGPGSIVSVRSGRSSLLASVSAPPAGAGAAPQEPSGQLEYLRVEFDHQLAGNFRRRQAQLQYDVRMVFGPVSRWDQTLEFLPPDQIAHGIFQLRCDQLHLAQVPGTPVDAPALGVVASGNAHLWGHQMHATGNRASYDQSKGLVVLEGDALANAALDYSDPFGRRADLKARKIFFRPATGEVQVEDAEGLDLTRGLPGGMNSRP